MNKTVKVDKLIERFVDMAKRDALLVNASKDDLVTQIIGTIVKTAMEDDCANVTNITPAKVDSGRARLENSIHTNNTGDVSKYLLDLLEAGSNIAIIGGNCKTRKLLADELMYCLRVMRGTVDAGYDTYNNIYMDYDMSGEMSRKEAIDKIIKGYQVVVADDADGCRDFIQMSRNALLSLSAVKQVDVATQIVASSYQYIIDIGESDDIIDELHVFQIIVNNVEKDLAESEIYNIFNFVRIHQEMLNE